MLPAAVGSGSPAQVQSRRDIPLMIAGLCHQLSIPHACLLARISPLDAYRAGAEAVRPLGCTSIQQASRKANSGLAAILLVAIYQYSVPLLRLAEALHYQ